MTSTLDNETCNVLEGLLDRYLPNSNKGRYYHLISYRYSYYILDDYLRVYNTVGLDVLMIYNSYSNNIRVKILANYSVVFNEAYDLPLSYKELGDIALNVFNVCNKLVENNDGLKKLIKF